MTDFGKKWVPEKKQPMGASIRESIFPPGPLKKKIEETQRALNSQVSKLDARTAKIRERDTALFNKVVASVQKHDSEHASAYSAELSENRKIMTTVTQSKMILEQISLRLATVQDLGDLAASMTPVVSVVKGIKSGLTNVIPDAGSELGEIGGMLNDIVTSAGQLSGLSTSFGPASEDAEKILAEDTVVAEKKISDRLPDLSISSTESIGLSSSDSNQ
jgi:division protein CdvB (Snf7/Vps24/ESCRT-III family)